MSDYTLVLPNIFIAMQLLQKTYNFLRRIKLLMQLICPRNVSKYYAENHDSINNVKYLHIDFVRYMFNKYIISFLSNE